MRRAVAIAAALMLLTPILGTAPLAAQGSVLCDGVPATIVGTDGNDLLLGTPGPDVIAGLDGNDVIRGFDGNDIICGDNGRDRLFGGKGSDRLFGGKKNDILKGDQGSDNLFGNQGKDRMVGGGGGDRLEGGSGAVDRLTGKGGRDVCLDPQGATTLYNTCENFTGQPISFDAFPAESRQLAESLSAIATLTDPLVTLIAALGRGYSYEQLEAAILAKTIGSDGSIPGVIPAVGQNTAGLRALQTEDALARARSVREWGTETEVEGADQALLTMILALAHLGYNATQILDAVISDAVTIVQDKTTGCSYMVDDQYRLVRPIIDSPAAPLECRGIILFHSLSHGTGAEVWSMVYNSTEALGGASSATHEWRGRLFTGDGPAAVESVGSGTSTSTGPCTAGLGGPVIANITVTLTYDVDLSLATQGVVGQSVGLIEFSATNPIVTDVTADVQGEDAELCKELTRSQVEDDPGILTPRGSATLRSGDSTVNVQGGSGGTITVSRID